MSASVKAEYQSPSVSKHENIRDITFHHSEWTCSLIGGHQGHGHERDDD